ncbi:MAG: 3-phosphoshikimate 1-carboxyvinyltransferase [Spirochaetia bacterium]|jgi:3-phosphoshikimate 1-carboxyvinyltransferase|nr:3-phosphoshikimate 1-carboxyvinyltransferase [Spirochaetia bacterium]
MQSMDTRITPTDIQGTITIPGSKSQTIRALLIATFSKGKSRIENALFSQDTIACIKACEAFGARITEKDTTLLVNATDVGSDGTPLSIDCANSGTTLYLAAGLAASLGKEITFTGDEQLCRRPIGPLLRAFSDLGAIVTLSDYPPFTIQGPLKGGSTSIDCPTSQYLSSLLLAAVLSKGDCEITTPLLYEKPYVRLTLAWLDSQHTNYHISKDLQHSCVAGNQQLYPIDVTIPGDYSSATFFFCLAAISATTLTIQGLDPDDTQGDRHVLDILAKMGCTYSWKGHSITITGPQKLKPCTFSLNEMPDALPALAITACFCNGTSEIIDTPQARLKETDRIATMHANLNRLGAETEERPAGLVIHGTGKLNGGTVEGYGDHRIIMAMAIGGIRAESPVTIKGSDACAVTFPTFFTLLESLRQKH